MNLTPHFKAEEFACRDGTPYPDAWAMTRLIFLCDVLEIVRQQVGPIRIASGYRTEEYNRKIGGARYSQHVQGRAADIVVNGKAPAIVHEAVLRLHKEHWISIGGLGLYPGFVHVDIRPGDRLASWVGSRSQS